MTSESQEKPALTDSPWFWLYIFATAGLVALTVMGPKYKSRQALEERKYQARLRAREMADQGVATTNLSDEEHLIITLQPLYVALGALFVGGWVLLWHHRFRRPHEQPGKSLPAQTSSQSD